MRVRMLPAFAAILFVFAVVTPVFGQGTGDSSSAAETRGESAQSQGSERSNAAENAGRGMNREGSPGEWEHGEHQPSENSAPQGHSPSDPDANGNGGMDKPGEDGGFDDDRDGNNGCGNDADREDDNNGWCGKPSFAGGSPTSSPSPGTSVGPTRTSRTSTPARVLGVQLRRAFGSVGGALATTGLAMVPVVVVAFGLMLAGSAMRKPRRPS